METLKFTCTSVFKKEGNFIIFAHKGILIERDRGREREDTLAEAMNRVRMKRSGGVSVSVCVGCV